jgi:hypothetical protein
MSIDLSALFLQKKRGQKEKMKERKTADKISIFRSLFAGLTHAYGTYDPASGRTRQVRAPVTDKVFFDHLVGRQPYGVYLLVKDRIRAIAADFDSENRLKLVEFVGTAKRYGIPAYVERSKSKGYHAWVFFEERGVLARKARWVLRHLLDEIEEPAAEIFPKQDALDTSTQYGNFINAPLFGALVSQGKTVFVDLMSFAPYPDQWDLLESVNKLKESDLDSIIEMNDLSAAPTPKDLSHNHAKNNSWHGLPTCARKMLRDGVSQFQRSSCFRLAVHLKRLGLPFDMAVAALKTWALKNRPLNGKGIIRDSEIISQASYAYNHPYAGYACGDAAIKPFCEPSCPVKQWRKSNETISSPGPDPKEGEIGKGGDSPIIS